MRPRPGPRLLEAFHAATLGVWLGVLVMTGAGAAVLFPEARELSPALPEFAGYGGEHWRIAGGRIAQRLFTVSDIIQLVMVFLFTATLTPLVMGGAIAGRWRGFRIAVGLLLLGVVAYRLGVLGPAMGEDLGAYWSAARAGETEAAERARAAFDTSHPLASRMMGATAVLVALALVGSLASLVRQGPRKEDGCPPDAP